VENEQQDEENVVIANVVTYHKHGSTPVAARHCRRVRSFM